MERVISFPHLGDYSVPIARFLKKITKTKVLIPPPMSKNTIDLGSKYAPDTACIPFKYNLGNFIEALEQGATTIVQAGGGCRYGYYSEVQEKILRDLGYQLEFVNLMDPGKVSVRKFYKEMKKINPRLTYTTLLHQGILTFLMIFYMDKIDELIRSRIGFETKQGEHLKLKKQMLEEFSSITGIHALRKKIRTYRKRFLKIPIEKPDHCLKVGIIGELYTSMEPFSNYFLEKKLAEMKIEIKRFTNATYLLFLKKWKQKKLLRSIEKYCTYTLGADGMDNVARTKYLVDAGYDGIIHIKPFGCTPEIGAMPIIQRLAREEQMPILFFSFDQETSEVGIQTRLEAFYDMLQMQKEGGNAWKDT